MVTANATSAQKLGYWSALACTVFSVGYILLQLFEWFGVLGSAGGPESSSTPLGIVLLLTPSLLLGSAFLVLMASLHQRTATASCPWRRCSPLSLSPVPARSVLRDGS